MGNSIIRSISKPTTNQERINSRSSTTTNNPTIRFSTSLLSLSNFNFYNKFVKSASATSSSTATTTTIAKQQNSQSFSTIQHTSIDDVPITAHQRSGWSFAIFNKSNKHRSNISNRPQNHHLERLSRSLPHFSFPRFLSKSTTKLSAQELASRSKTIWPTPTVILIFSPQFKLVNREYLHSLYDFGGIVARGAFGVVYRVIDREERKEYALKVLSKSQIIRDNGVQQLKNEVDIQSICGHNSFIVKCIAFWQSHREIYLLSEFISGGELFDSIRKFSYKLVQLYVAEIAVALDFLHNAGVIYRDLKPENILLDDNLHIKLIDFGLSKWLKIGQRTNTICGTLQYMAPEVLNGEPYGHAVDWYALGVVACRMLTDQYPQIIQLNMTNSKSLPLNTLDEPDHIVLVNPPITEQKLLPCSNTSPNISSSFNDKIRESSKSIRLPAEAELLPTECIDLLQRLLEFKPEMRIRSIFLLQRIAFYKGFNFEDVRKQRIAPRELMDPTEIY